MNRGLTHVLVNWVARQTMNNCLKILLSVITIVIGLGAILPNLQAGEFRHHEAHEHGVAHLNVAHDGKNLYIELTSPAANIVGFEYQPHTQEQKAAVKEAIKKLEAGEALFVLPAGAEGGLAESKVHTDIASKSDHKSEDAHTHDHNESSKQDEEDKHRHSENHESNKHERHSEFKAEYHFVCKKSENLVYIDVMLFSVFPGIEHIEVQILTDTKQTALELTAKKKKIIF
jgi:hypothetical protein